MQNKNYKISVIIPTYNRAKDLIVAVRSALDQTFPVHEILVCDDGSTDNSKELIDNLNDPKVKWIDCGKNGGPAIPRNIGIKNSSGNWLAFLDSDDEWLPKKIERQIEAIERLAVLAVSSNASRMVSGDDKGVYLNYTKNIIGLTDLFLQNTVICSTVLVNKHLITSTSYFPEDKTLIAFEDFALWLRISTKSNFAYINEPLIKYFDNVNTSIRSGFQMDSWDVYGIVIPDFKIWVNRNKINLSANQKQELKSLTKRIKNKGKPTAWDNFKNLAKKKLNINR